jgi:hypothetical protein
VDGNRDAASSPQEADESDRIRVGSKALQMHVQRISGSIE